MGIMSDKFHTYTNPTHEFTAIVLQHIADKLYARAEELMHKDYTTEEVIGLVNDAWTDLDQGIEQMDNITRHLDQILEDNYEKKS